MNIKKVCTYSHTDPDEAPRLVAVLEYSSTGKIILDEMYTPDGELEHKTTYAYDQHDRRVRQTSYLNDDEISEDQVLERSDSGDIQKVSISYLDESQTIQAYTWSEDKTRLEIQIHDEAGIAEGFEQLIYDQDRLIEKSVFDQEHQLQERETYTYDEHGRVAEQTEYDSKGNVELVTRYSYHESGSITLRHSVNGKGKIIERIEAQYDEKGRMAGSMMNTGYQTRFTYDDQEKTRIEEHFLPNGELRYFAKSWFDSEGRTLREEKPASVLTYTYEFF